MPNQVDVFRAGAEFLRAGSAAHRDLAIAEIASGQAGLVTRAQLLKAGVSDDAIAYRIRTRRLVRVGRGVYAVGRADPSSSGIRRAALAAIGADAVVSHLSAAADLGLRGEPAVLDVTCPRRIAPREGIRLHIRALDVDDVRIEDGIPLTSPAQTIFDLGTMLGHPAHLKAANEAFVAQICEIGDLRNTVARNAGRPGIAAFRRLLATLDPDGHRVRSPLEARLNAFLRARGYPPWESNARLRVGPDLIEPDVLWRAQRVIVEADGRDPHLAPLTFASDRRRDRRLQAEGWQPVRITSTDLDRRPDELDDDLRALLSSASRD